jgi:hypothetical protein
MKLSYLALKILREAVEGGGMIMVTESFEPAGGFQIHINGKPFGAGTKDSRAEAELKEAMSELERHGLVRAVSHERTIFEVTAPGYKLVDNTK